jgi:hypothetical protein
MPLFDQIRDVVLSFVEKRINVAEFRQAFGPLYAQTGNSDSQTIELATNIESTYALFVEELIDADELQVRFKNLVPALALNPINFIGTLKTGTKGQDLNPEPESSRSNANHFTATVCA